MAPDDSLLNIKGKRRKEKERVGEQTPFEKPLKSKITTKQKCICAHVCSPYMIFLQLKANFIFSFGSSDR